MFILKNKLEEVLRCILHVIVSAIPKKQRFVLRGFPDYEDNLLAINNELLNRQLTEIVWVVDDTSIKPPFDINRIVKVVKRGSIQDFYYSSTSRYLFITHGHFLSSTPKNQICVNLWHGIPFKQVGVKQGMKRRADTCLTCTSSFVKSIFHESFELPKDNIYVTGQPRTDRMLKANREKIKSVLFEENRTSDYIFLWLPTFRNTNFLGGKLDGKVFNNIFNCSDFCSEDFNEILKSKNALCFVKPHPMAEKYSEEKNLTNIIFINDGWLLSREISLYEIIGSVDCLISDISSVIADFMLLDRPIALLFEDIAEYEASRGFSFNPVTEYLPAKVTKNFDEFTVEIKKILDNQDVFRGRRERLKDIFFEYCDADSASRILDVVFSKPSNK